MYQDRVINKFIWLPTILPCSTERHLYLFKWLVFTKVRQRMGLQGKWIDICWEF
jgi:hypothetical protein